jgi:hypothetical protein
VGLVSFDEEVDAVVVEVDTYEEVVVSASLVTGN